MLSVKGESISMKRKGAKRTTNNFNRRKKNIDSKGRLIVKIKDIIAYDTSIDKTLRNNAFSSILIQPDGRISVRNTTPSSKYRSPYYAE